MGDRANIVVRQGKTNQDDVWFYTHWRGSEIEDVVKKSLAKKQRWDDPSYLARIIFTNLLAGDTTDIGFGISTRIGDNEYPILVVDIPEQSIWYIEESALKDGRIPDTYRPQKMAGFNTFIGCSAESVQA